MRTADTSREEGMGLLTLLLPLVFVFALAAALSMLSVAGQQSATRSVRWMRAFYAADSGAQIGNALVRATGTSMTSTTLTESIDEWPVTVVIDKISEGVYRVTSTSSVHEEQATVEMWITFETVAGFGLQSAFELSVGDSVDVTSDFGFYFDSNAVINGYDHETYLDADGRGVLNSDQTLAKPGIGTHPQPGDPSFDLTMLSNSELDGDPPTATDLVSHEDEINQLFLRAETDADVFVSGSDLLLKDENSPDFGSETDPVLAYAQVNDGGLFKMDSNFVGHGVLLVDVGAEATVEMLSNVRWYGLVVFRMDPNETYGDGERNLFFDSNMAIIGGAAMLIDDAADSLASDNQLLETMSNAQVLYSSKMLDSLGALSSPTGSSDGDPNVASFRGR